MTKFIQFIYDKIRESMGYPSTLQHLLDECPGISCHLSEPMKDIAAYHIVEWKNWGHSWHRPHGNLLGWRYHSGRYSSFEIHRPEFKNFVLCESVDNWGCDIQAVAGLLASKSSLDGFSCLDEWIEANSRKMISPVTDEKLRENLAHTQIRILHSERTSDHFARYHWDGRIFLINSGGSHHFAAARYIAARIGCPVPLQGTLRTYTINSMAVDSLCNDFDMFVIPDEPALTNGFHDAMNAFLATYFLQSLPSPYENMRVILLPKQERRSAKVATVLRTADLFDLGKHLIGLVEQQASYIAGS